MSHSILRGTRPTPMHWQRTLENYRSALKTCRDELDAEDNAMRRWINIRSVESQVYNMTAQAEFLPRSSNFNMIVLKPFITRCVLYILSPRLQISGECFRLRDYMPLGDVCSEIFRIFGQEPPTASEDDTFEDLWGQALRNKDNALSSITEGEDGELRIAKKLFYIFLGSVGNLFRYSKLRPWEVATLLTGWIEEIDFMDRAAAEARESGDEETAKRYEATIVATHLEAPDLDFDRVFELVINFFATRVYYAYQAPLLRTMMGRRNTPIKHKSPLDRLPTVVLDLILDNYRVFSVEAEDAFREMGLLDLWENFTRL
jgi:hypothetical protein